MLPFDFLFKKKKKEKEKPGAIRALLRHIVNNHGLVRWSVFTGNVGVRRGRTVFELLEKSPGLGIQRLDVD